MTTTNKIRTGEGRDYAEQTSALSVTQQMADPDETRINGDDEDMDDEDMDDDMDDDTDDDLAADDDFEVDEESIEEDVTTDDTDEA